MRLLLVPLLVLLPSVAFAQALEGVPAPKPPPKGETVDEAIMRVTLDRLLGRTVEELFQELGEPEDGWPNGRYFQVMWRKGKGKDACEFWFDVDEKRTARQWYWKGDCSGA